MDYREKLLSHLAEKEVQRIARKVILALQKMAGMVPDLKSAWDEVCVQVQFQHFVEWHAYEGMIEALIAQHLKKLDSSTKEAIWLQTNPGRDWGKERERGTMEEEDAIPFDDWDTMNHIYEEVLRAATDWKNERIERFNRQE